MNYLNAKQLAFILDIEVQEGREKIVFAHCKDKGIDVPKRRRKEDIEEPKTPEQKKEARAWLEYSEFPLALSIECLSARLNLPTLQQMVDDIRHNYLKRPASKKWILCDYPEKKRKTQDTNSKISIPSALRSMLPDVVQKEIIREWESRYPNFRFK